MQQWELEAKASDEAQRLYEKEFSFYNPYTVTMDDEGIPFTQRKEYYHLVERELALRGEEINRPFDGPFFKITKYQKQK